MSNRMGEVRTGVGGLVARAAILAGRPIVAGSWGSQGLGFSTAATRAAAWTLLASCDEADAMAARQDGEDRG